jgi:hypothetical protein
MVDAVYLIVTRLKAQSSVTSLLNGGSVFGEVKPEAFDVPSGKIAVVVKQAGGGAHSEIPSLTSLRLQVTIWAPVNQGLAARNVARAIYDALHGTQNVSGYKSCLCVLAPQSYPDPDTGFATVVTFYLVTAVG